jgi:hypothetical protein
VSFVVKDLDKINRPSRLRRAIRFDLFLFVNQQSFAQQYRDRRCHYYCYYWRSGNGISYWRHYSTELSFKGRFFRVGWAVINHHLRANRIAIDHLLVQIYQLYFVKSMSAEIGFGGEIISGGNVSETGEQTDVQY